MDSTELGPLNRTHSTAKEDGDNIACYDQEEACTTMSSDDCHTTGAISVMHSRTEHLQVRCACTSSSKSLPSQIIDALCAAPKVHRQMLHLPLNTSKDTMLTIAVFYQLLHSHSTCTAAPVNFLASTKRSFHLHWRLWCLVS
jgi:hypothetical protein